MNNYAPVFCSVVEPRSNWLHAVALLIQSLRTYGGEFATCPFAVLVAGQAPSLTLIAEDRKSNLLVFGADRHPAIPHLNKIMALELCDTLTFSHLVLLDHDTIVLHLEELPRFLTDRVHARPNYKYGLAHRLGRDYAALLTTRNMPWARINYFNSGVLTAPREHGNALRSTWQHWADMLSVPYREHPLTEQIAFAVALVEARIPYAVLPVQYNQINWRELSTDASIIHYNSFDRLNRHVKSELLESYARFRRFLAHTDNRFWCLYGAQVQALLNPDLDRLVLTLREAIQYPDQMKGPAL